jgi:hypothetical protein
MTAQIKNPGKYSYLKVDPVKKAYNPIPIVERGNKESKIGIIENKIK